MEKSKYIFLIFFINIIFSAQNKEVRALWIVRDHMVNADLIDKFVDFAIKNKFNNIFVQIRGRGDAFYNSSFVPKSKLIENNFDPLNYIISKCSGENIKIHAWLNIYYLWSSSKRPVSDNHLLLKKPNWLDRKEDDKYILDGKYLYSNNYNIDGEGFFLAPTNIEVNNYLLEVIYELLNNYPLDGIHYDYIRYHSINYGYNINGYKYLSNNKDGNDIDIKLLNNLKRNAITDFVKRSKYIIKEILPNSIISAAVKPNIYNAKLIYGQEWDLWLSAGYLDWVVPMNYLVDDNDFIKNIYIIKDNIPEKYYSKIIIGVSTYNQSARSAGRKVSRLKKMNFKNISIFSYNTMSQKPYYWKRLKKYF